MSEVYLLMRLYYYYWLFWQGCVSVVDCRRLLKCGPDFFLQSWQLEFRVDVIKALSGLIERAHNIKNQWTCSFSLSPPFSLSSLFSLSSPFSLSPPSSPSLLPLLPLFSLLPLSSLSSPFSLSPPSSPSLLPLSSLSSPFSLSPPSLLLPPLCFLQLVRDANRRLYTVFVSWQWIGHLRVIWWAVWSCARLSCSIDFICCYKLCISGWTVNRTLTCRSAPVCRLNKNLAWLTGR